MTGIDQSMVSNILNATTPTGTAGVPGTFTVLNALAMKLKINSTASTATTPGTEITVADTTGGTVYAAGGWTLGTTGSTPSATGLPVGVPFITQSLTCQTLGLSIVSFDLTSQAGVRSWFGTFNGQPVVVAIGNTFQITGGSGVAAGIQLSLA